MKKRLSVLSILLIIVIALSSSPYAALDADKFEARKVTAYFYSMEKPYKLTLLFNSELPEIPYIDVYYYFWMITGNPGSPLEKTGDNTYCLPRKNGKMIIDTEADTVIIENFEFFVSGGGTSQKISYAFIETTVEGEDKPLFLDLGKYGFDIVEIDNRVFFPVSILNDIFSDESKVAEYIDGNLYFSMADGTPDGYFDRTSVYERTEYSPALAEFYYNELCFQFDNFYGRPSSAPLAKYIEELGFDKALDTYSDDTRFAKQLLLSTSPSDFTVGLCLLSVPLFDGGHTILHYDISNESNYYPEASLCKSWVDNFYNSYEEKWIKAYEAYTYVYDKLFANKENIRNTRAECLKKYDKAMEWDNAALYVCGNTAVFSFDYFFYEIITPLKQALDYAREHAIKNFVLDLSVNGGGGIDECLYTATMLINKNTKSAKTIEKTLKTNTGNIILQSYSFDLNLDGKTDELDREVVYDFNFAVLTSSGSYSAANELISLAKDNGIMIIGQRCGGGSCVLRRFYTAASEYVIVSSVSKYLDKNNEETDFGVPVDVDLTKAFTGRFTPDYYEYFDAETYGLYDYDDFYDFEALGRYIDEFYDKGDVNGDGVKNNKDLIDLFSYVSENNEYAAKYDINSNGRINNRDVLALFKKVCEA